MGYIQILNSGFDYSHYNEGLGNFSLQGTEEFVARINYSWHDVFFRFKYNNQKRTVGITKTSRSDFSSFQC